MEQRSPTNTGFTPGALVERRMTFESKKKLSLLQSLKQKQRNSKLRLHWFADATGVLYLRQRRGRVSEFRPGSVRLVKGARVEHKETGEIGTVVGGTKKKFCSLVEWDKKVGEKETTFTKAKKSNLTLPRFESFAEASWNVEWEDGSQQRLRQKQLLPVGALPPHPIPACVGTVCITGI